MQTYRPDKVTHQNDQRAGQSLRTRRRSLSRNHQPEVDPALDGAGEAWGAGAEAVPVGVPDGAPEVNANQDEADVLV